MKDEGVRLLMGSRMAEKELEAQRRKLFSLLDMLPNSLRVFGLCEGIEEDTLMLRDESVSAK